MAKTLNLEHGGAVTVAAGRQARPGDFTSRMLGLEVHPSGGGAHARVDLTREEVDRIWRWLGAWCDPALRGP